MEITEKNKNIAIFMGAIEERWYPENKTTKTSGIYLEMPHGDYFPNGFRYVEESLLKYHSSSEWQETVLDKIVEDGANIRIISKSKNQHECLIENNDTYYIVIEGDDKKDVIFDAISTYALNKITKLPKKE